MKTIAVKNVAINIGKFISKNSPTILTIATVTGIGVTAFFCTNATIKAVRIVDELEEEKEEPLTKLEIVQACWKCYIPAMASAGGSIVCAISSNAVNARRNAALASAYVLATDALKTYKDKTEEILGASKSQQIQSEINQDVFKNNPHDNATLIRTGYGETLCLDSISGQYFRSSIEKVRWAINEANKELLNGGYVTINDLYYLLGLKESVLGSELGWHIEDGLIIVNFDSELNPDKEPCLVLNYPSLPRYRYG